MTEPLGPARLAGTRDLEEILAELREMIETARMMPMSSSVLINRTESLALVEDALAMVPEEMRRSRWMLKEREDFLAQTQRDADEIMDSARAQVERMVERTEIARDARRDAEKIVLDAEADSRRLRHETEDYIDARLEAFEALLGRTLAAVARGRERLQVDLGPPEVEPGDENVDPGPPIFDQDKTQI